MSNSTLSNKLIYDLILKEYNINIVGVVTF
mgnify:CR=1 FL=1